MKKISTLVLTLLSLGSVTSAWADAITTDQLPTGYYKFVNCGSNRHTHLFNNYFMESNTYHASMMGEDDGNTNNYIWKITNDGTSTTISILNGEGTPIVRENTSKSTNDHTTLTTLTPLASYSTYVTSVFFNEALFATTNADTNHQYGDYTALTYFKNATNAQKSDACKWNLQQVDVTSKHVYTVTITGATGAYITRASTGEHAFTTGFFVSDDAITSDDLTASSVTNYDAAISVDETAQTITVTYSLGKAALAEVISSARDLLNTRGIGYPTTSSTAYATLQTAITTADAVTSDYSTAATTLQTAMNTYKKTTTGLQMPEDGKVYRIYALWANGTKVYAVNDNKIATTKYYTSGSTSTRTDNTDLWVMQKVGAYYTMASATADRVFTYLQSGSSKNTASTTIYVASKNVINLGALNLNPGNNSVNIVMKSDGNYLDQYTGNSTNSGDWCSEWYFEEVTDFAGQDVNFTASNDGKNYATLNLPYAVTLPTGVTAYKTDNVTDTEVSLTEYKTAGQVLPANTPVLLISDTEGSKTFAPAAYVASESTGFEGTLGATAVTTSGAYILAKAADEVKFYLLSSSNNTVNANKAYLVINSANSQALSFNFGGNPTGISNAANAETINAPIFDLSGRRVAKTVKGGIYLQNGKKFVK